MHILLVEPNPIGRKLLNGHLCSAGHQVEACSTAAQAHEIILGRPDIGAVIVNLDLAPEDGLEVCWDMRLISGPSRPLYVLAMSVARCTHDLIQALDCGADDIIALPVAPEILFARMRAAERLIGLQKEMVKLATCDPLTGALNRRAFLEQADQLIVACNEAPVSAVMIDVDRFKSINDTFGHQAGDEVIKAVAMLGLEEEGLFARFGGEEFVLLLADKDANQAKARAEALRVKLADLPIQSGETVMRVTSSFGVAERRSDEGLESLINRADKALYDAKTSGRNRVCVANGTAERRAA